MGVRLAHATWALLVIATVTACSTSSTSSTPRPAAPTPDERAAAVSPFTPSSQPATPVIETPRPVPSSSLREQGRCAASQLSLSVGPAQGAAGTDYQPMRLRNIGAPCTLQGFPGVALLSSTGAPLGQPAGRNGSHGPTVRLATGQTAHASFGIANAGNYPAADCKSVQSTSVQVYPPGATTRLTAPFSVQACSATTVQQLRVAAITAGTG